MPIFSKDLRVIFISMSFQTRTIPFRLLCMCVLFLLAFETLSYAQDSKFRGLETGNYGDENSKEQVLILPLFDKSPTMTSLLARDVFDKLNASKVEDVRYYYSPIGPKYNKDSFESILQKYLVDSKFTTAIFVRITDTYIEDRTSTDNKSKKESELESALKTRVDSSDLKYSVKLEVYHKANRIPASDIEISDSMQDILNATTFDSSSKQNTDEFYNYIEDSSKSTNFTTIHVEKTSNADAKYLLKVNDQKVAMSSSQPNTAYLLPGSYYVDVYQVFDTDSDSKEVKIGDFKGNFEKEDSAVEIEFVDESLEEYEKKPLVKDLYAKYLFSTELFINMAYPNVVTESEENTIYTEALSFGIALRFAPRKYVPLYARAKISNTNPDPTNNNQNNLFTGNLALGAFVNFFKHLDAYIGIGGGFVLSKNYSGGTLDVLDNQKTLYELTGELGLSFNMGIFRASQIYLAFFYEPAFVYIPTSNTNTTNNAGNSITEPNYFVSNYSLAFGWRF